LAAGEEDAVMIKTFADDESSVRIMKPETISATILKEIK